MNFDKKIILQVIPRMELGGAESGTLEISNFMTKKGWKVIVTSAGGELVKKLNIYKVTHVNLQLDSKNPFIIFINIFRLALIIKKFKVKIVHVRSRAPAWSAYYACKFFKNIKFVTTVHGAYKNQNFLKKFYNSIMLKSDKIIAISKYIKNYLLKEYKFTKKKLEKINVIPRGVNLSKYNYKNVDSNRLFKKLKEWEISDDALVVIFPSRIAPFKGHKTLIKAISILKKNIKKKIIFLLVGSINKNSSFEREITSIINDYKVHENIKFLGTCSDMPAAYKLSDIVVSPADKPEGFGRIIIEAQSMERLILASAHGGSLELIKNNKNGFLFEPLNALDLANKLKLLINLSKKEKKKIIKFAKKDVSEKYDISKMCYLNLQLYNSLI